MKTRKAISLLIAAVLAAGLLAGCGPDNPINDYFKDISINDGSAQLTALQSVNVISFSAFANGVEYVATGGEIEGKHELSNGTQISGAGTYNGSIPNVVLGQGAKVTFNFDTGGNKPERICVYLENGEVLEKKS